MGKPHSQQQIPQSNGNKLDYEIVNDFYILKG
jgi:hypothetical protein